MVHDWACQQFGQGPDLLILHGWAMQGSVFLPLAECLAADFRITLLDLPGHGRSPAGAGLGLEAAWSGLSRMLSALDLQRPHLLGWSLGGQLALALALREPHRLGRLVLVASTPCFAARPDWPLGMSTQDFDRFSAALLADPMATVKRFLALQTLDDPMAWQSLRRIQQAGDWQVPDPGCLQDGLQLLATLDLRAQLHRLAIPTLLIQGERDRVVRPQVAVWLQATLPQAQLLRLPRLGHAPFLSDPQTCAQAIRTHLQ